MMRRRATLLAMVLLAVGALSAEAQVSPNGFQVTAHAGWQTFAGGSGVEGGVTLGTNATYYFSTSLGFGLWTDLVITETAGDMFPPAALSYGDSTIFRTVNQAVDIWQYGVHGKLQLAGRAAPFLLIGAGGYTLFLDPQQTGSNSNFSGFVARFGVGVDYAVSDVMGFQLMVADSYYPSWKPDRLLPVREDYRNTRFPELNPDPGKLSESVHNFKFVVGVTMVPGGL
ncbi:MAG: hypothetical protein AMS25_10390 [Gemmatimonas sp. SM23_52]|nr:MAG: hypothetical protein AMS25_10390 [Gemmatimonas sp. SM23_52]